MSITEPILTPVQQQAFDGLLSRIPVGDVLVLRGNAGSGKTTILERIKGTCGATFLGMRQFMDALRTGSPQAIEESFLEVMEQALSTADSVILDDFHLISNVVDSRGYPRPNLLDIALSALLADARASGKKLLFAVEDEVPAILWRQAYCLKIEDFTGDDYRALTERHPIVEPWIAGFC